MSVVALSCMMPGSSFDVLFLTKAVAVKYVTFSVQGTCKSRLSLNCIIRIVPISVLL